MRPQLHKLPLIKDSSFLYKNWHCPYFDKPWHFHEEYELVMIDKSKGTKFIGDKVSDFEEGDLMLIGPRITNVWKFRLWFIVFILLLKFIYYEYKSSCRHSSQVKSTQLWKRDR